ncbi:GGDEF domain-containing protein [Paenibacillus sp. J31TS4]|uniref:GGDEF domain-containing protein n=1 Tax=Paenibacillus sp. J31TS4 TaxID=2807195 RepID=UPI001B0FF9B4|nr:diguanylate cyclase [Paenibacillus sp. J31TS4]GIP38351.1 GGDEF domain-containing protein [Paenibacillus sp. J31TS4]
MNKGVTPLLKDLLLNGSVLLAFLFVGNWLMTLPRLAALYRPRPRLTPLLVGLLGGALGMLLMSVTIHLPPNVLIDLRNLGVVLAALYGGLPASVLAASLIGATRVLLVGEWNGATAAALSSLLATAAGCGLLVRLPGWLLLRWTLLTGWSLAVSSTFLTYLLYGGPYLGSVLVSYTIVFTVISYLAFQCLEYMKRSHLLFERYKAEAGTDFLTGLANVRRFDALVPELLAASRLHGEPLSLIAVDIDHFKRVNDTYGHPAGDQILQILAGLLKNASRSYDIVTRNGGEEFSLLLPDCQQDKAGEIADRLRQTVERHAFRLADGQMLHITVSLGIASDDGLANAAELVRRADDALYEAKKTGRNRACQHNANTLSLSK